MSGTNEGYDTLFRTLKGYARNPNFGGILLVGLGCEVMQVPDLVGQGRLRAGRQLPLHDDPADRRHPRAPSTRGLKVLREMAEVANKAARAPAPVSNI